MAKKAKRIATLHLGEIHYALLKYLAKHDPTPTRNAQIRRAIEFYVTSHPGWDPKSFVAFVKKSFLDTLEDDDSRETLLDEMDRLIQVRDADATWRPKTPFDGPTAGADFDV